MINTAGIVICIFSEQKTNTLFKCQARNYLYNFSFSNEFVMNHRNRSMSSHGIMQPNPALCESHLATPRHVLEHEFGQGATCLVCKRGCPGFQLHYWRKQCINCGCGIPDHDIDFTNIKPYFVTVGRITER